MPRSRSRRKCLRTGQRIATKSTPVSLRVLRGASRGGRITGAAVLDCGEEFMRRFVTIGLALCSAIVFSGPLLAHHSFAAEFGDKQPLKLTGTITKVEWTNPHIWYFVEVKNPDGTTTTWALSG